MTWISDDNGYDISILSLYVQAIRHIFLIMRCKCPHLLSQNQKRELLYPATSSPMLPSCVVYVFVRMHVRMQVYMHLCMNQLPMSVYVSYKMCVCVYVCLHVCLYVPWHTTTTTTNQPTSHPQVHRQQYHSMGLDATKINICSLMILYVHIYKPCIYT